MEFQEHLKKYLPDREIADLVRSLDGKARKSVLVNALKIDDAFLLSRFSSLVPHPLTEHCFLYDEETDPLGKHIFHEQGLYYLFEPCSALASFFLRPEKEDIVLDLCAAPGGKTAHAAILKADQGLIVSNEISSPRACLLSSNVERMGFGNVIVTRNSIEDFASYANFFDKIILDAPCSGSGMFRKETKMREDWTYSKVRACAEVQKDLIVKAYRLLKPGGKMIYSTCSFSYEEDEEVIAHLLCSSDAEAESLPEYSGFYVSESGYGVHLFPHRFPGEGHYYCLIRKPGESVCNAPACDEEESLFGVKGYLYSSNRAFYRLPRRFDFRKLRVLRGGVRIGVKEKYGFEFDHALSRYIRDYPNSIELSGEEALRYLNGEALSLPCEEGAVWVKYQGNALGWGKAVRGRINNRYPKGLRKNHVVF